MINLRWLPVFIWVIVICFLSFTSLDELPFPSFIGWDKLAHFGMYFILEFLLLYAIGFKKKQLVLVSSFAVFFSAITELIQHFLVLNRHGEIADFAANSFGIFFAYVIIRKHIKN